MALVERGGSAMETVLAALDSRREAAAGLDVVAGGARSFVFWSIWNAGEGEPVQSEDSAGVPTVSLERAGFSADALESKVQGEEKLILELKSHVGSPGSLKIDAFCALLKTHLETLDIRAAHRLKDWLNFDHLMGDTVSGDSGIRELLKKTAGQLSRRLILVLLKCCLKLEFWDPVCALLECGLVSANEYPELIERLVEVGNVALLCLCIRHMPDLHPSQLVLILRLFLAFGGKHQKSFQVVKQVWRLVTISVIENAWKTSQEEMPVDIGNEEFKRRQSQIAHNKAAAIKFSAAFDGFSPSELCLHCCVGSGLDEAVLTSVILELDNAEALTLIRYLNKWLEKYSLKLVHLQKLRKYERHLVPSLHVVLRWLGVILEGRYASFVLSQGLRDELKVTQRLVCSFVTIGGKLGSLEGIAKHILRRSSLPSQRPGYSSSEHIIEYLQIN